MGVQEPEQEKLFYTNINIAERIRRDHPLRRIAAKVDFGNPIGVKPTRIVAERIQN